MDLPNNTPAGGEAVPAVSAGDGGFTPERSAAAPAAADNTGVFSKKNELKVEKSDRSGSIWLSSFVFKKKPQAASDGPSKHKDLQIFSPDAQGQKQMVKRKNLTSVALVTGAGFMMLALHSCGQKPAPAEETAGAKPAAAGDSQAMRVTRVEMRDLADEFVASGRLVVREEAAVGSELPGYRVAAVYVDEGDWVKQGQAMAKLDDALLQAQIAQAEATLATQQASLDFKKSQLARAESLEQEGAFSKELLEQRRMETAGAQASLAASQAQVNEMKVRQSRMTLRAPVAGMVLQRAIRPGDISGGATTPYFRISRDGLIELDAEMPDAKLALLKEGSPATVTLSTGEAIEGKVRFVSPRVDQNTSLGRARIQLPFDKALRPGSFAEARFGSSSNGALSVPASAIRYEAGGPSVMLVGDDNKVKQTPVKLGERTGDYVQLVQGPPAGARVLAVGSSFTLDGDVIQPVEDGVAQATPAAPGSK
jgi:HlyD family secretion protein